MNNTNNITDNLFIDIGNSAIKWQYKNNLKSILIDGFNTSLLPQDNNITVWLADVSNSNISKNISKNYQIVNIVNSTKTYKKLTNCYQKITNLGVDRWLGLIATYELYPKQHALILSSGTATTIDILASSGEHKGGLIMPGLWLLNNSFANFSGDIYNELVDTSITNSTDKAWLNGTKSLWINGIITTISKLLTPKTKLILTGGDAGILMPYIDYNYKYHNNLVIKGLEFYSRAKLGNKFEGKKYAK